MIEGITISAIVAGVAAILLAVAKLIEALAKKRGESLPPPPRDAADSSSNVQFSLDDTGRFRAIVLPQSPEEKLEAAIESLSGITGKLSRVATSAEIAEVRETLLKSIESNRAEIVGLHRRVQRIEDSIPPPRPPSKFNPKVKLVE